LNTKKQKTLLGKMNVIMPIIIIILILIGSLPTDRALASQIPIAENDNFTININTQLAISAPGLLVNDSNPSKQPLSAIKLTDPCNGTLLLNRDGSFTYTPDLNYSGTDSFTYVANDGQDDSNPATVILTIYPVNDLAEQPNAITQANDVSSQAASLSFGITVTPLAPTNGATDVVTSPNLRVHVTDANNSNLQVSFYGRQKTNIAASNFTLAVIPDTQFYTINTGGNTYFNAETTWIANNQTSQNIVFVTHTGDITQNGDNDTDDSEWVIADSAMSILERDPSNPSDDVPYSISPGNHDALGSVGGVLSHYDAHFPVSRFASKPYYSGHYGTNNNNSYSLFSAGGMHFIMINLACTTSTPSSAVLAWAGGLLKDDVSRRGIVVCHNAMETNGAFTSTGQAVFNALDDNANWFLLLCGHAGTTGRVDQGTDGHSIYSLEADYEGSPNGGNGYIRLLQFQPANDQIQVKTYSPTINNGAGGYDDPDNDITGPYTMQSPDFNLIGTVTVPSSSDASVIWDGLAHGTQYEWYAVARNSTNNSVGITQSFTTVAAPKAITAFSFASPAATGTINESAHTIAVTVPYGTNVNALVASFTTTGASVKVGSATQVSGTTPNNFSSPVTYTVIGDDASMQDYVVTVTIAANPAKAITAFGFTSPAAIGVITEATHTIAVTVPYGTNVNALVASFTTTGASVKVGSTTQVSGTTPNNFSSPVTYTVTAADASTQDYVVTVIVAANPAKAITAFSFASPAATGTINESAHTIAVTVPYGTNVSALVASFTTTGASVKVGSTTQVSGTTANNFSSPVTYTVTAADTSTQNYVVTVTVAANPAKAITVFSFASPAAIGAITEATHTIAVTVPYGTNVTALVASFTTTGASVEVGSTTQVSETTPNDFSNPVTYTVTAADTSTQNYVVTVTVAANPAKDITAFSFTSPAATGVITGTNIAVTVPYGTNVTALVASFTTTGASVKVGSTTQVSETTPNNFSSPVTYTVTADDASTQNYVVTVTVAANSAKAITAFSFASPAATGVITEATHTIAVAVPYGTNVTALVASFTTTGASVEVGSTTQVSGITSNNFSGPVTYTVTAADASTQDYVVTVASSPTITTTFNPPSDGWVLESSENSGKGGSTNSTAKTLRLGDDAAKKQYRSILSFNTGASLPDNAVITKVTLKVRRLGVTGGGNPITTFQGFLVDIKKGYFGTRSWLQTSDFQSAASKSGLGPFKPALSSNWYSIDLTAGKTYINKTSTSSGLTQIRLRFKLDDNNNTTANYLSLYSGNASSPYRPQLVIEYHMP
jgi:hypothetical protein